MKRKFSILLVVVLWLTACGGSELGDSSPWREPTDPSEAAGSEEVVAASSSTALSTLPEPQFEVWHGAFDAKSIGFELGVEFLRRDTVDLGTQAELISDSGGAYGYWQPYDIDPTASDRGALIVLRVEKGCGHGRGLQVHTPHNGTYDHTNSTTKKGDLALWFGPGSPRQTLQIRGLGFWGDGRPCSSALIDLYAGDASTPIQSDLYALGSVLSDAEIRALLSEFGIDEATEPRSGPGLILPDRGWFDVAAPIQLLRQPVVALIECQQPGNSLDFKVQLPDYGSSLSTRNTQGARITVALQPGASRAIQIASEGCHVTRVQVFVETPMRSTPCTECVDGSVPRWERGDCLILGYASGESPYEPFGDEYVVPCNSPHDAEVFLAKSYDADAQYPDFKAMDHDELLEELCGGSAGRIGVILDSRWDISVYYPDREEWGIGLRYGTCFLYLADPDDVWDGGRPRF